MGDKPLNIHVPFLSDYVDSDQEPPEMYQVDGQIHYHGNSIPWWYSKAKNYGHALDMVFSALYKHGISADGVTHVAKLVDKALQDRAHPEGHVLLPKEPTEAMIEAGRWEAFERRLVGDPEGVALESAIAAIYRAMLKENDSE